MPPSHSPASSLSRRLSQWICGLHGHEMQLRIGSGHLALRCRHCGLDSPGWGLDTSARTPVGPPAEPAAPAATASPASATAR
jgi:hypothetical protein